MNKQGVPNFLFEGAPMPLGTRTECTDVVNRYEWEIENAGKFPDRARIVSEIFELGLRVGYEKGRSDGNNLDPLGVQGVDNG